MITLLADRLARARVTEALRAEQPLTHCETPRQLMDEAADGAALAIIEARDRTGVSTSELVRSLRIQFPLVTIVGYIDPARGTPSQDAAALARSGAHELVVRGFDDCGLAFRQALACARHSSTAELVLASVASILPQEALPLVRFCCENASRSLSVDQLARALGVHRKTVAARLRRWSLPPPHEVIAWSRLLTAVRALETRGRSVEQVALDCDFPSGGALRNLLKRHTGYRPGEVRRQGAFSALVGEFREILVRDRLPGRSQGPSSLHGRPRDFPTSIRRFPSGACGPAPAAPSWSASSVRPAEKHDPTRNREPSTRAESMTLTQPPGACITRSVRVVTLAHAVGTVLLDSSGGRRMTLDGFQSRVWRLLADRPVLPALVEQLRDDAARSEQLAEDVLQLLSRWRAMGVIAWR